MPVNLLDAMQTPPPLSEDQKIRSLQAQVLEMTRPLIYISKYWETQVFQETLSGLTPEAFLKALDRLMADYPEID